MTRIPSRLLEYSVFLGVSTSPEARFQLACAEDGSEESRSGDIFFWYVLWEGVSFPCCLICELKKKRKERKRPKKENQGVFFSLVEYHFPSFQVSSLCC